MPYGNFRETELLAHERQWIIAGGIVLAALAGYINVILLGFFHVPVSHMSGAASRVGIDIARYDFSDLKIIAGIIGGFFIGAACSGILIGRSTLKPGRRYGAVLCAEGMILAVSTRLLLMGSKAAVPIAAIACGLQNAMASSYYGLVIRTTHVTGIVTDLGIMLGHWMRGQGVRSWKVVLLAGVFLGFIGGGVLGGAALASFGVKALWFAAVACVVLGLSYSIRVHFWHSKNLIERSEN